MRDNQMALAVNCLSAIYECSFNRMFFFDTFKRCYATKWKVPGSIPDEVIFFFLIYLILPAALGPEVYSTSNRN
jgi:hypothetical protein